jgi:peptide/nickel transport system substrate-binding protein
MRRILATFLAGGMLATFACGNSGSTTTSTTAKQGGTLKVAVGIDPDTLDPAALTTTTAAQIVDMIAEPLVTIDQTGAVKPLLADKWDTSADGKSITFTLHPGVKFSDGTPLTAAAVKASIERVCCSTVTFKPQPGILGGKTGIDHVDAVDDSHAKVVLKAPIAPAVAALTQTNFAIMCPSTLTTAPNTPATVQQPCGTGPYKFKERVNGDHITLARNDSYWGTKALYATQEYRIIPEAATREAAVRSGQVDVAVLPPANDIPALQQDKTVQVILGPSDRTLFISLNNQDQVQPLLQKKEVRQALNYAIDKNAIVKNQMFGAAQVLDAPAAKSLFGYCSVGSYPYDPAKAKSMLAAAGASNMKVKFSAPTGRYVQDIQVAQAVASQLRDVGVQVDGPSTSDWPSYLATVNIPAPGKLDMHFLGWAPAYLDMSQQMQQFWSTQWPNAGLATSYYKNPTVDDLIVKAQSETDQAARKADYCTAEKQVWDDAPWIFLYNQKNPIVTTSKVQGVYGLPNEKFVTTWSHPA